VTVEFSQKIKIWHKYSTPQALTERVLLFPISINKHPPPTVCTLFLDVEVFGVMCLQDILGGRAGRWCPLADDIGMICFDFCIGLCHEFMMQK
jgi:hypothetical protein